MVEGTLNISEIVITNEHTELLEISALQLLTLSNAMT